MAALEKKHKTLCSHYNSLRAKYQAVSNRKSFDAFMKKLGDERRQLYSDVNEYKKEIKRLALLIEELHIKNRQKIGRAHV